MSKALIVLIPKPHKDQLYCVSYCPISLINSDVKILAKGLDCRLNDVIPTIIGVDQTGFIPGALLLLIYIHFLLTFRAVLALYTHKAFEWPYLQEVLAKFGFGDTFLRWIQLLYNKPRARLRVDNFISGSFPILRGTRQGCPLSPLLFALAIEPLAALIRSSSLITGLVIGDLEEKVSLYADNMLIYLAEPQSSLSALLSITTPVFK